MSKQFSKSLFEYICDYEAQLKTVFYFSFAVLMFSLFSLLKLEPGTATYIVTVFNIVGLSVLSLFSGFVVFKCR
ncbi:hypothetical protein SAMN05421858_3586 [Haladaptatus litoreus]|uniref:YrhK-like protein n=1 Tax=Haladaptatus litoreus TaxID=553468 RepID=A0A1N7DFZ6_9EURY|nr:hypothetical protein SAMN05421858_3586 [Haladaptatus litoreus]